MTSLHDLRGVLRAARRRVRRARRRTWTGSWADYGLLDAADRAEIRERCARLGYPLLGRWRGENHT